MSEPKTKIEVDPDWRFRKLVKRIREIRRNYREAINSENYTYEMNKELEIRISCLSHILDKSTDIGMDMPILVKGKDYHDGYDPWVEG
jgi:hypothetical protein